MVVGSVCVSGATGSAGALAIDVAGCSCYWCCSCCFCWLMAFAGIGGISVAGIVGAADVAGPLAVGNYVMMMVLLLVYAGFKLLNRNGGSVSLFGAQQTDLLQGC